MHDIIRLLPETLANQIAAGEVVQRPASVVKELLENSIDAGAKDIKLFIGDAGKTLLQIVDDGKGMSATDARMSFERHATSKIDKVEDLFALRTFGFRGEALASIAAVAQVELKSKREEDELGTLVRIEGSEVKLQESVSLPTGTSISVKNLFYNVPARRNFLKSNPVEIKHIIEEFQHVALANPEAGFTMVNEGEELFVLRPGKLAKRIVGVFGKSYQENIVPCEEEVQFVKLWGYVGKPNTGKKTRGEQFFFVNGRYIRSTYLHHAIMSAYEGFIPEGTFPFYCLFIEMDPSKVDVNVHPTKTEVKFEDERSLYAVLRSGARRALSTMGIGATLDFEYDTRFFEGNPSPTSFSSIPTPSSPRLPREENPMQERQQSNLRHWEKLYTPSHVPDWASRELPDLNNLPEEEASRQIPMQGMEVTVESAANRLEAHADTTPKAHSPEQQAVQIKSKYIIVPFRSGVMVIDSVAAYERILYDKYIGQHVGIAPQKLIFPRTVALSKSDFTLFEAYQNEIEALGIDASPFGQHDVIIHALPPDLLDDDDTTLLEGILEQLKHFDAQPTVPRQQKVARALAKRGSKKIARPLMASEIHHLIGQLFATSNPNLSPSGAKITHLIELGKMEDWFA